MKKTLISLALTALALGGMAAAQDNIPGVPLARPQATPTPPVAAAPVQPAQAPSDAPALPAQGTVARRGTTSAPAGTARAGVRKAAPQGVAQQTVRPNAAAPRTNRANPNMAQPQANPANPNLAPGQLKAAATPTPDINIQIGVKLERIRVLRSKAFTAVKADPDQPGEEAAWNPEMTLQMRLTPSREWDVLDVAECAIRQVLDQNGQPLPSIRPVGSLNPASGAAELNPQAPVFHKSENGATLLLRTAPPAAGVLGFKQLDARIRATMGYRRTVTVKDIRTQVGASLTRDTGLDDVVLQVAEVGTDGVDLMALGEVSRIGAIEFEDATGKKINPYNVESMIKEVPKQPNITAKEAKEWHFSFSQLPAKVNMVVTLYPVMIPRNLTVTFKDVPLP